MSTKKKQKASSSNTQNSEHELDSKPSTSNSDSRQNWRDSCKNVLAINKYALTEGVLCDVTFLVGPENSAFPAHRLFLALGSPVFEAMFYGPLAEKGDTVTIPDVSAEGFQNLLRSLYTNDPNIKNSEIAFETYIAADKYCVTALKEQCEKYLGATKLTPSNVWKHLDRAIFWNCTTVADHCLKFLTRDIESALLHSSFLDVTEKCIESILKLENLNVSEMKLLHSVVYWAEHKTSSAQAFKDLVSPLLKYVRFGALTPSDFILFLEMGKKKEFLKIEDALMILKHLVVPLNCPLPDWCCTKTWRGSSQEESFPDESELKKSGKKRKRHESKYEKSGFDYDTCSNSSYTSDMSTSSSSISSSSSSSSSSDSFDSDEF